jgi:uncharacterized membrane protein YphA (DoxX/SURF4 family)
MTTQTLTRQWRLPGAIVAVILLLAAAFALHTHWNLYPVVSGNPDYAAPLSGDVPAATE